MYLKLKEINGYDDYYYPLDPENETWAEVLGLLESALDDKYLKNDSNIDGVKLEIEIVSKMPDDVEIEGG